LQSTDREIASLNVNCGTAVEGDDLLTVELEHDRHDGPLGPGRSALNARFFTIFAFGNTET